MDNQDTVTCAKCGSRINPDDANWQVEGYENDPICSDCEDAITNENS